MAKTEAGLIASIRSKIVGAAGAVRNVVPSRFRSAITGKFVTREEADANPETTIKEKDRR